MQDFSLFLCIDCGGTKTAAAIANSKGQIVSRGFGGPANYNDVGQAKFVQAITRAVTQALSEISGFEKISVPLASPVFTSVWIGAAGIDRKQDVVDVTPVLADIFKVEVGPKLRITNDTHLLASPLASYPEADTAITIIGGTGSNVTAYQRGMTDGVLQEFGRCGGWGWILGDEGSGFHVGKETLRALLADADWASVTGETTKGLSKVQEAVFRHFSISNAYDLFSVVYAEEPTSSIVGSPVGQGYLALERKHRIASLAPLVFKLAFDEDNESAISILKGTAHALAGQIRGVMNVPAHKTERRVNPDRTVLCFGGSLVGIKEYRQMIIDDLANDGLKFAGAEFVGDVTACGAASLARTFS